MIRINLLPVRAAQKKEKLRSQISVLVLVIIAALLACGGLYFKITTDIDQQKTEIAEINAEISQLNAKIGQVGRYKKLQDELRSKLEVLGKLKEAKSGPVRLLDELSRVLPQKLWLTSFKESGGGISLNGVGINENTVADFMQKLEQSPFYQNIELQVTEQISQDGMKLQKFSLSARAESPVQKQAAGSKQ